MNSRGAVIVVDDGSKDNSYRTIWKKFKNNPRVYLLKHQLNLGKGAAMKTGIKLAWKLGFNSIIFIDADGQHDPRHIKEFEKALEMVDLAFGYRELNGEMPFIRKWCNIIAKKLVGTLFNVKRKEFLCFNKKIYKQIKWSSSRYGVETEIATRVGKKHLSYQEIKIDTIYVDKYKGVSLIDAFKVLAKIPWWYIK